MCAAVFIGVCGWKAISTRDPRAISLPFGSAVSVFVICYFGAMVLSVLVSKTPENAIGPLLQRFSVYLFFLALIYTVRDRAGLRLCIVGLVLVGLFMSIAGCYEIATHKAVVGPMDLEEVTRRENPSGLFGGASGSSFRVQQC